jgi:nucleotide-binding universal stress UspA family protein
MLHIHTILHATDFSGPSRNAFAVAYALARDYGARLLLVHVREPVLVAFGEYGMTPPPPSEDLPELHARLRQLAPADAAVPIEYHVAEGEPAAEIVAMAEENGIDLIVVGTHGRRGLERVLMGSVAEQVVRKAPCPVLTVKTPFPSEKRAARRRAEEVITA